MLVVAALVLHGGTAALGSAEGCGDGLHAVPRRAASAAGVRAALGAVPQTEKKKERKGEKNYLNFYIYLFIYLNIFIFKSLFLTF